MKPNKKLLYLHNKGFASKDLGKMNVTLLQVFSMCNAFSKIGYDVKLFMEGGQEAKLLLKEFKTTAFSEDIFFEVHFWKKYHSNRFINRFGVANKVKQILEDQNPDVVFTREPAFIKPSVKFGCKTIFESHNSKQHNRFYLIHYFLQRIILKYSYDKNFICLLSISDSLNSYWKDCGADTTKLFSWHDGFDLSLFKQYKEKDEARKILQLPNNKKIVTYTGGLYPDRCIENIIYLAKEYPEVNFIVIGGPQKGKYTYQEMAKRMNVLNISFIGYIDHIEIPIYLYASDVLLALWSRKVPTINYCSPLKIFEYMASGRVVLAHSFPTIQEVMTDGINAVLCKPDNLDILVEKLKKALDYSNSNSIGIKARNVAFNRYSWDNRVNEINKFVCKKITQ
ncbi:MAG: glycosyltransferase [Flavobacteriaceae bacterium]|nr:glycosyltransferase [Flavobacteriaceae bacterium]